MEDSVSKFINKRLLEIHRDPVSKKTTGWLHFLYEKLLSHNNLLKELSEGYKPTQNQIDFARSISLHTIFNVFTRNKKFPKISPTRYLSPDNVKFEPILNLNLFKLSIGSLQKILFKLSKVMDKEQTVIDIKKMLMSEILLIESRINKIETEISKTPEILTREAALLKKDPPRKPKISVITASYNLAPFVEETMRSVLNQNCGNFEHIVIDGASTDGSVELLKKYPNIILVSEKDTGYPDAFWKGLNMAQGEYILQCAISDGYATDNWLKKCIEILDADTDTSLVWGFPGRLTENSKFIAIARSQFHYEEAPEKEEMFNYWLKTFFVYPEGNMCVRKSVILKCYPSVEECKNEDILDWLEFSYRFNRLGYISTHIPILANFGRTHGNQLGERLGNNGILDGKYKNFRKKISFYRLKLLLGINKHQFIDASGKYLSIHFNRKKFAKEFIRFKIINLFKIDKKIFKPESYIKYIKRYFT